MVKFAFLEQEGKEDKKEVVKAVESPPKIVKEKKVEKVDDDYCERARNELLKALDKFGELKGEKFVCISQKEHEQMKEGACLRCRYYGSCDYGASQYCNNLQRLKDLDINNVFFSPRFDGIYCKYYEYR